MRVQGKREGLGKLKLGINEPPLRQHMVFTGASILADVMADFREVWISRSAYEEDPQGVLHGAAHR